MAEKRRADRLDEAASSVQDKPNQPKRVKWDVGWFDGEYKSKSTNRKYDPVTNRAIVKPRGPQGNKPQNVKGVMPGWDFYEHMKDENKYILMNIEQDIASLQDVAWEDPAALRYISRLQTRGRVPSFSIVVFSGGVLLRMQILVRDSVKYDYGGHLLECHFVENRNSKICLTFRSFEPSRFIRYFLNRFEEDTAFSALMDEDAEGEDEDFFNDEKDEGSKSCATAEAKERPGQVNSTLTHFALDILRPRRFEEGDPLSEELDPTKLKHALVELPGGTAFKNFPNEALAKAKQYTGWPDFDDALEVSRIGDSSGPSNATQSIPGTRVCDGVSVICDKEANPLLGATSTTFDGDSPDAAIVLPENTEGRGSNEVPRDDEASKKLKHERSSLNEEAAATLAENSPETPPVLLDSEASTQTDNASSFTVGGTAEAPLVISDDDYDAEVFVPLPSQAATTPLATDVVNDKDVDEPRAEVDCNLHLLEPLPSEAGDWLDIWEQEEAWSQFVTVG